MGSSAKRPERPAWSSVRQPTGIARGYFAPHAVRDRADTCTERYELELENADIGPLPEALPRSLCECLASSLLDKNGIMRLALVDRGLLEPLALEPVTQKDASACIDALWVPNVELATGLPHE